MAENQPNKPSYFRDVWRETRPVRVHLGFGLVVLVCFMVFDLAFVQCEVWLPAKKEFFESLERIDETLIVVLFGLFAAYTFGLTLIIIIKGVRRAWTELE